MKSARPIFTVLLIALCAGPVLAEGWGFSAGPSVGVLKTPGGKTERGYGAEASLMYNNIHLNFMGGSSSGGAGWGTFGFTRSTGNNGTLRVYTEGGTWMILCLGGGFSLVYEHGRHRKTDTHLFVGLPLTHPAIINESLNMMPYVLPFYRAHWTVKGHFDGHEFGVMAKLGFNSI